MIKRPNRYVSEEGKEVWKQLEHLQRFGYSPGQSFSDWLDLMLNSLLSFTENFSKPDFLERAQTGNFEGKYNDRYMGIVRKYDSKKPKGERPIDYFANAFGLLVKETQEKQRDVLGQIYMERITFGEAGQFFTPHNVTDMMAKMTSNEKRDREKVFDPCCGSGRMLLSTAKENPNAIFYGKDIDVRCAKMTALNMYFFDLNSYVTCGNGLTNEWSVGWKTGKGGFIWEILPEQFSQRLPSVENVLKPAEVKEIAARPGDQLNLGL